MRAYADFYVATDGRDENPGTWAEPFATLDRAREVVRRARATGRDGALTVLLRGGVYYIDETVVFDTADSSVAGTTYAGYPGETPILSAGVPVTEWSKVATDTGASGTDRRAFPREAWENLWVAASPTGRRVTGLYRGTARLPRARSEAFAATTDEARDPSDEFYLTHMMVPEGVIREDHEVSGGDLVVIPRHNWTMNILPLVAFDRKTGALETRFPCTYPLLPNRRSASAWLENLPWVLSKPGEWICTDDGTIYYWPEDEEEPKDIVATNLTELIRVEGDIDYDGETDSPAHGIHFENLELRHGARFQWHGRTGWGVQHDWEAFDRPTALLRFRGAEGSSVTGCRITASDGAAVRLDLHARDITVSGNHIFGIGGCGVVLAGYGPGTKDVNRRNVIFNNHIHHIGEVTWHSPGIFLWQSGENRVAHNLIHHTGYTGVVASGRIKWDRAGQAECSRTIRWDEVEAFVGPTYVQPLWHQAWKADWDRREPLLHSRNNIIEHNEIHHVMQIMGDGNGVYISGAGRGNVVAHNRVHSCPSPHMAEGLRCDDDQHETTLADNLIYGLGGFATGITIKGITTIVRNIIACPAVERTRRGMISLEVGPLTGTVVRNNVVYCTSAEHALYYQGPRIHGAGPEPLLRDCKADGNVYWYTGDSSPAEAHLSTERVHGIELHSRAADPGFVDPEAGDFRLAEGAPARELGISDDPAGHAGLTDSYALE